MGNMSDETELVSPLYSVQEIANLIFRMASGYDDRDGLVIMERIHQQIHDGRILVNSYFTGTVTDNTSIDLLIPIRNSTIHLGIEVIAGGDALFEVYENPTATATGTMNPSYNKNRYVGDEINNSGIYILPNISNVGNKIITEFIAGGEKKSTGGSLIMGDEWILNKNKSYLFRLTNKAGSPKNLQFIFTYYYIT